MTKKKDEHVLLVLVIATALALPMAAWSGFVISKLWGWFLVPVGVVSIGVWEGAGLSLLIHLLTMDTTISRDSEKSAAERLGVAMSYGLITPAFFLAFGALYHAFA
jgi:hypothetical protein